jgi:predicted Zn-dependent protease
MDSLAVPLLRLNRFREAAQCSREVLELAPQEPHHYQRLASILADCNAPGVRDPGEAIRVAKQGLALLPVDRDLWLVLGRAEYRAGNWQAAIEAIDKSMEFGAGGDAREWLVSAMARWQQGERDVARRWYTRAVNWMEEHTLDYPMLGLWRADADDLLGERSAAMPNGARAFAAPQA